LKDDAPRIFRAIDKAGREGADTLMVQDPDSLYHASATIREKARITEDDATWRSVPGYAGWYEVSDRGEVSSLARGGTSGGILKTHVNNAGYRFVRLSKYGTVKTVTVARLVLLTFRGQPTAPGARAVHGAGGRLDDSLDNLWWG
jgi:hypothetical protein